MFSPIVRRIVAVALAAPALVVATAVAASAAEQPAAVAHYHATGAAANALGASNWRVAAGSARCGHDMIAWYRAGTADANALGANTSTVNAATRSSGDFGRRGVNRPFQATTPVHTAELTAYRSDPGSTGAVYHGSGAAANAWGATTDDTTSAVGESGGNGFVWNDTSMASATALGADAGHTTGYAFWGNGGWNHHRDGWGGSGVGYSSSLAHAGADGASAGDVDSAASFH
jgi:hypothetical protein